MPFSFESVPLLLLAGGMLLVIFSIAVIRRPALPRLSYGLIAMGLILLSIAIGGLQWRRSSVREVLVMVDVSPSTRIATYRDRSTLARRIQQLLGDAPHRILLFASNPTPDRGDAILADVACERTIFSPPPSDAILLFSDARFDLPLIAPRTFPVIDPALELPIDSSVDTLQIRDRDLIVQVNVTGQPRELLLQGTSTSQPVRIDPGNTTLVRPLRDATASAQFSPGDAWPENDGLSIHAPPKSTSEKWWWGAAAPPGWRSFDPSNYPTSATAYLSPSVIVLNNLPASALSPAQRPLQQFVRDLGGSLVILGGDHAFAAGDYGSTPLELMSPLASHPPQPATQWIVLVDGSGSMGEATPEGSRWNVAAKAVNQLLPHLPPADVAMIGSFADQITWWSNGKTIRETTSLPLPPASLSPRGPTNLEAALLDITRNASGAIPKRLIILTDADAQITNPSSLATEMKTKSLSLHVLAIGQGSGLTALKEIAATTGGSVTSVDAAASWATGLLELSRSAMPDPISRTPLPVQFIPPFNAPARDVTPWNHTWLKNDATPLATAIFLSEKTFPAARWRFGAGQVAATGFATSTAEALKLADLISRPPRDPRFQVTWDIGRQLRVTVTAIDQKKPMNDESFDLNLIDPDQVAPPTTHTFPQTAPGIYQLSLPAPRHPLFASVHHQKQQLDQIAVADRYAPEFDSIGNDHAAMHQLADQTGGRVIDVRDTKPIDFHWPRRDISLSSWLTTLAALFIGLGLIHWKRS